MTSPILVFGAGGRVASELLPLSAALLGCGGDITHAPTVAEAVESSGAAAIINLAACTLPRAEKPEAHDEALRVNGDAIQTMMRFGVPIVHLSTEYVFGGEKTAPYEPDDSNLNPLGHYGFSKARGELHLQLGDKPYALIRTCGVYLRDKPNFLETVLSKARAGEPMDVVADTLYTPTDARELARAILTATERLIEDPSVSGTYHFAGPDVMSYLDFARLVAEAAGVSVELRPTTAAEREATEGIKRPRNSALNSDKFAKVFGLRHRPTQDCLRELLS